MTNTWKILTFGTATIAILAAANKKQCAGGAIRNMTQLNRDIWDFMGVLQKYLAGRPRSPRAAVPVPKS
jgi:hypothetical protein